MNLRFDKRFCSMIARGEKSSTIRKRRTVEIGETLHLFCEQVDSSRKIGKAIIVSCTNITCTPGGVWWVSGQQCLTHEEANEMAMNVGFTDANDLLYFLKKVYGRGESNFTLIEWASFVASEDAKILRGSK